MAAATAVIDNGAATGSAAKQGATSDATATREPAPVLWEPALRESAAEPAAVWRSVPREPATSIWEPTAPVRRPTAAVWQPATVIREPTATVRAATLRHAAA